MKSIGLFEAKFLSLLEQNVAGGAASVFGAGSAGGPGQSGNQFPSQNDSAYAPGDARFPKILGSKRRGKKRKGFIQRRSFPGF